MNQADKMMMYIYILCIVALIFLALVVYKSCYISKKRNANYLGSIGCTVFVFLGYIGRSCAPLIPSPFLGNISNVCIYLGGSFIVLFFVLGLAKNKFVRIGCMSLQAINTLLAILSLWFDIYFIVDPKTAVYKRGDAFFVAYIFAAIMIFVWIFYLLKENKNTDMGDKIKIVAMLAVEVLAILLQIFVEDLKIIYVGVTFILEIYYAFIIETDGKLDKMTGAHSRRLYIRTVEDLKLDEKYSIILLDINSLKEINDEHGHDKGDLLIKTVADTLKKQVGSNGKVFRIGGDEFVCLLKFDNEKETKKLQTSIHQFLSIRQIDLGFEVSTSSGIAIHEGNEDYSRTFHRADNKMYEMKHEYHSKK